MTPNVVADVGNSRIKWGLCFSERVAQTASLPHDDTVAWERQLHQWREFDQKRWAVAGVHPGQRDLLVGWLRQCGKEVIVVDSFRMLPVEVGVDRPEQVGIDRLLNGLAALDRIRRGESCVIVDAGSAVTVDWIDEGGVFRGGVIFPGLRLMAKALNDYTAKLPLVEVRETNSAVPGTNTEAAIKAGIFWAVVGGVHAILRQLMAQRLNPPRTPLIFLTGGDAQLLAPVFEQDVIIWPEMTLEGVRLAVVLHS